MHSRWWAAIAGAGVLSISSVAVGLPWDLDMADTQAKKGYSLEMVDVPDGAVAQPSMLSPTSNHSPNFKRGSAEANAMAAPRATPASVAQGEVMYRTYCSPCHGDDGVKLGPVAEAGRFPGVVPLAGKSGVSKLRTDPWIYLTIRNGGAIMPSYSWAMSDAEMWSVVHYVRTLSGAAYKPPAPAEETP